MYRSYSPFENRNPYPQPPLAPEGLRDERRSERLFEGATPAGPATVPADASALPDLLVRMFVAGSNAERRAIVDQEVRALGFDDMTYGRISMVHGEAVPTSLAVSVGDRAWVRRYIERRYHIVDPRVHLALRSNLPFRWDLERLLHEGSAGRAGEEVRRFVESMAEAQVRSGVMLPLPGLVDGERSVVSFVSASPHLHAHDDAHTARMYMLALSLHEFQCRRAVESLRPAAPAKMRLTGRQDQVLQGLANGMSDREIAHALNLSLHGVDYHLRRLRECFQAHNRVELLQAALRCGVR